jgi:tripartite-type tricarboxylate transporter receptor subunit TctC
MKSCWYSAIMVATIGLGSDAAVAQSWPSKPIRAFIPFAAGSATDIVPRAVFEPLSAELGQSIIVENRGGAGGTLGMGAVVRADPDGYTILANSSAHTIAPWIVPNFPFDLTKDLSSVLMIGQNANILIVSPSKGWKTVQELVAAAKAKPGSINYGSAGVGTATHVAAEKFRVAAGFEAVHVAYKGGAEALADIVAGRIDFYYCPISTALPFIEDKRVLALAASTSARAPELPDAIDYRGFRLLVSPVGKGWRAMIYAPGSLAALPESPAMLEKSFREAIVAEAKKIVDARLNAKN